MFKATKLLSAASVHFGFQKPKLADPFSQLTTIIIFTWLPAENTEEIVPA